MEILFWVIVFVIVAGLIAIKNMCPECDRLSAMSNTGEIEQGKRKSVCKHCGHVVWTKVSSGGGGYGGGFFGGNGGGNGG